MLLACTFDGSLVLDQEARARAGPARVPQTKRIKEKWRSLFSASHSRPHKGGFVGSVCRGLRWRDSGGARVKRRASERSMTEVNYHPAEVSAASASITRRPPLTHHQPDAAPASPPHLPPRARKRTSRKKDHLGWKLRGRRAVTQGGRFPPARTG